MNDSTRSAAFPDPAGVLSGFEALFQASPSPFLVVTPPEYTIVAVNEAYLATTRTERAAIVGRTLLDVFPAHPSPPGTGGMSGLRASLERVVTERRTDVMEPVRYDLPQPGGGREERWWSPRNAPVFGPGGEIVCIIHHVEDVTGRVQAEVALREHGTWLEGQGRTLVAAVHGASLHTTLGELVRTAVDTLGEGVRAAFYLADEGGATLHHVVGMPDEYAREVDGFAIGPDSLACGLATEIGEPVLTADVREEPRWARWLWLAERHDYRGCWSFPIRSARGTMVGTLALYWREPRAAREREIRFASLMTSTAALVIARHREAAVRERAENALRTALADREALLKELHHRVKNNLQVVTSLLEMQARQAGNLRVASLLGEARDRITAIASIHELLYQSGSYAEVDFTEYARRLVRHVVALHEGDPRVDASVEGERIAIDLSRAVPLGLLLNELVSNAYKHAFPPGRKGALRIAMNQEDGHLRMHVADTGVGLPANRSPGTLGLELVHMLAKQLGGTVEMDGTAGTSVHVRVPIDGPPA